MRFWLIAVLFTMKPWLVRERNILQWNSLMDFQFGLFYLGWDKKVACTGKWENVPHSFLRLPLNSLKHGRLNIYTSALACLMLKAHLHSRVNEWKSFRQNTSSGWWVPGHFMVLVHTGSTSFSGHGRQRPRGLLGGSVEKHNTADIAVCLKRGDQCI